MSKHNNNIKLSTLAILVANSLYSVDTLAENIPMGFEEFYQIKPQKISLAIAGIENPIDVIADVNYDLVRLSEQSASQQRIREYLQKHNLKKAAIDAILQDFSDGLLAENNCNLNDKNCSVHTLLNKANYIFDYDNAKVKLFVANNMFAPQSQQAEYYQINNEKNALLNWTEFAFYKSNRSDVDFTFRDELTWGIGKGHLVFNAQYQYQNREFDIYDAYYQQDFNDIKYSLGYLGQYSNNLNSTDILQYDTNFSGLGLTINSSRNLVKGKAKALQRVQFYSPEAAQLVITRGDRILLQRYVDAGQQSISYAELPSGIYAIKIELKNGDRTIYSEQKQIVNTNSFDLAVKEYDYMFNLGYFEDLEQDDAYSNIDDRDRLYLRGAVSYRPIENAIFSFGQAMNADDLMFQLGAKFIVNQNIDARLTTSYFANDAKYYSAQLNLYNFYFSASKLDVMGNSTSLSSLIYDDVNSTQFGAGFSSSLFGGQAYFNYYQYKDYQLDNSFTKGKNLSGTFSYPFFGGNLDLSVTYNDLDSGFNDVNTSISWSRNFTDAFSGRVSSQFNDDNYASSRADVTYRKKIKDTHFSSTASVITDKDGNTDSQINASLNGDTKYLAYSAYGYAASDDIASISGNISGSQVITSDSIDFTSKKAQSYLKIEPIYQKSDNRNSLNYTLKMNNQFNKRDKFADKSKLVALNPYNYLEVYLDADTSNGELDNDSYEDFVSPGTLHHVKTKVTPLESRLIVLEDMFNSPVQSANCIGEGCINIEPLSSDGIFRINHRKNAQVEIYAANNFCITKKIRTNTAYSEAVCLPDLRNERTKLTRANVKANDYILLDIVPSSPLTKEIIRDIEKLALETKHVEVNGLNYVYIKNKNRFKLSKQANLLNKLNAQSVNRFATVTN